MLVKVIEGLAITADTTSGLRIWDLRSRDLVAQTPLHGTDDNAAPSCIAVDDCGIDDETIDVALGFSDGGFGVWKFDRVYRRLICRYRHEQSSNGELLGVAFSHPYLLTATGSVLISLYTFDVPAKPPGVDRTSEGECGRQYEGRRSTDKTGKAYGTHDDDSGHPPGRLKLPSGDSPQGSLSFALPAPYLLTSLRSHTSKPPLALAIRRTTVTTIASIAYTFSTRQGWVIGIQDLHIESSASGLEVAPEITATRLAYTSPVSTGSLSYNPATPPARPSWLLGNDYSSFTRNRDAPGAQPEPDRGPMTLCYNHPYLLATLPDNTLILHLCTSNASALSISPGIRLWGHTSGISDAEITARGKAVSVSSRGEEMRVWELEGRPSTVQSKSVEIRPDTSSPIAAGPHDATHSARGKPFTELDERRNWVGFDDEMVIVLKESQGEESLMVYDFT
ncbi:F-box only protein 15 [Pleurostoma richardsiae]|uniref:F-box only protein 15 n=1 Tax=Pleurostoma richardsiae TaxID=41990 RepID=A0AA38R847_9PEZI|nr:F-box only protein 15 [Pleurostoma richardsiae]